MEKLTAVSGSRILTLVLPDPIAEVSLPVVSALPHDITDLEREIRIISFYSALNSHKLP